MSLYKRGKVWWARYTDAGGKKRRVSLRTPRRQEAEDLYGELTRAERVRRLGLGSGKTNRVRLADLVKGFLDERAGLKRNTQDIYRSAFCRLPNILRLPFTPSVAIDEPEVVPGLLKALDSATVTDLTPEAVMGWRVTKARETSPRTANLIVGNIRLLLRWAADAGLIASNPLGGVRPLKEPRAQRRALSASEIRRLLEASPRNQRLVWWTLVTTGMRRGELIGLTWEDLDLQKRIAYVRTSKTGDGRAVPLREDLAKELRRWREERNASDTDPVFANRAGRRWNGDTLWHRLQTCARRAGIGRVSVHELRHTAVSHLADAGAPVGMIMDIVGHKSPAMTLSLYRHRLTTGHATVEALDFSGTNRAQSKTSQPPSRAAV